MHFTERTRRVMTLESAVLEFLELYSAVYLRLHRRLPKRSVVTPQSLAVLQHLAFSGPLTVTEAARHMERAQSVMSELVDGLVAKGLLARIKDSRDKRRTLVWLTEQGRRVLEGGRDVLSRELLERALAAMRPDERTSLLASMRALIQAAETLSTRSTRKEPP